MKSKITLSVLSLGFLILIEFDFILIYLSVLFLVFLKELINKTIFNKLFYNLIFSYLLISAFSLSGIYTFLYHSDYNGLNLPFSILILLPVFVIIKNKKIRQNIRFGETLFFMSPLKWANFLIIKERQNNRIKWLEILFFLSIFFLNEFFFKKSFDFWHDQIEIIGLNSCNFIQALFLSCNNFFKAISPIISFYSLISIINLLFKKRIGFKLIKTKYYLLKIIFSVLLLTFFGTQNIYDYWIILKGFLNIKTILIYFNEGYILWPLQMSYVTLCVFVLYLVLLMMLLKFSHHNKIRNIIFCVLLSIFSFSVTQFNFTDYYKDIATNNHYQKPSKQLFNSLNDNELLRQRLNIQKEPSSIFDMKIRKKQTHNIIQDTASSFIIKSTRLKRFNKFNLDIGSLKSTDIFEIRKNEWVTIQFVLISSVNDVKLTSINLENKLFDYEFYKGEYVFCNSSHYKRMINPDGSFVQKRQKRQKPKGWTLDPLIPINQDEINLSIPNYQNRIIFLNLFCSENVDSSTYNLNVFFDIDLNGEQHLKNAEIKIKVLNNTIPKHPTLQTALNFDPIWLNNYYNDSLMSQKNASKHCNFLLKHKITPTNIYYNKIRFPPISLMDSILKITGGKLCIGYLGKNYFSNKYHLFDDFLKNFQMIKKRGLEEKVFLNVFDELSSDEDYLFDSLRLLLLRNEINSIDVLSTAMELKDLKEFITIQCPRIDVFETELLKSRFDSSWTYFCTSPKSYPYVHLDMPLSDIDILFEKVKNNRVNGLLYWNLNFWKNNVDVQDSIKYFRPNFWNTHSARGALNGGGVLIYPGPCGELYPSIRLLKIRDGLESLDF